MQKSSDEETEHDSEELAALLDALIARARVLLSEVNLFRDRLKAVREELNVITAKFTSTIHSELTMLEKLSERQHEASAIHIARSSNLSFLETVWNLVKGSKNVVALKQKLYPHSPTQQMPQAMRHVQISNINHESRGSKSESVSLDAIVDAGHTWIKVSLVTNNRLLFDLAKQGWNAASSADDDLAQGPFDDSDNETEIPILRTAKELSRAAQSFRVRTRKPQVHLVLPRVQPGKVPEVDSILEACRSTGARIICGDDAQQAIHAPNIAHALSTMVPDPFGAFTDTLNIDCTILLALVSEFSHAKVCKEPWFHLGLQRQVEIEGNENLLPSLLYPVMIRRKLVCTQTAARRMREIVATIGTSSEKARTAIIMGDEAGKSSDDLVEDLRQLSAYVAPAELQLPISIVEDDETIYERKLPPQAVAIGSHMTAINKSVFLWGWAAGYTTITSNRVATRQIENALEKYEDLIDSVWPKIWLCPTARSLVGKEKRGAQNRKGKPTGVWPLPDPLRREQQRRNGLDVLTMREGHEVEDLRPQGYPCAEVLDAKEAATASRNRRDPA